MVPFLAPASLCTGELRAERNDSTYTVKLPTLITTWASTEQSQSSSWGRRFRLPFRLPQVDGASCVCNWTSLCAVPPRSDLFSAGDAPPRRLPLSAGENEAIPAASQAPRANPALLHLRSPWLRKGEALRSPLIQREIHGGKLRCQNSVTPSTAPVWKVEWCTDIRDKWTNYAAFHACSVLQMEGLECSVICWKQWRGMLFNSSPQRLIFDTSCYLVNILSDLGSYAMTRSDDFAQRHCVLKFKRFGKQANICTCS